MPEAMQGEVIGQLFRAVAKIAAIANKDAEGDVVVKSVGLEEAAGSFTATITWEDKT